MHRPRHLSGLAAALLLAPALSAAEPAKDAPPSGKVSYFKDVRPIFQQHCQGCHQPAKPMGGYVMTSHADLFKKGDRDKPGVVAGNVGKSFLVELCTPAADGKVEMPKGRDPIPPHQLKTIIAWIEQGALDDTPKSDVTTLVDQDHPPVYTQPPVLTTVAYSPDSKLLAVNGYHEILLHEADGDDQPLARLVGLSEQLTSVAFSPDGKLLAAAGGSPARFGEVQVWDVEKRKLKLSVVATFDTLYGLSWSPDGSLLAFGCCDNTVRAIESATGKQVLFQGAHSDWVLGTAFSAEGLFVASVSRDRSMKLTEVATNRFIDNVTSITPGALKGGLAAVARRPQKERKMAPVPPDTPGVPAKIYDELLIGGSDGVPRLYKMHRESKRVIGDDANKLREFEKLPGRIFSCDFNSDGSLFVVSSSQDGKGEVRVYQAADGKKVSTFEGQAGGVYGVAFRPDGKAVASVGFDGTVRLNDPATGKLLREFPAVPLKK